MAAVPLLASVPLLLIGVSTMLLAVLVTRSLRDEAVVESLHLGLRRLGEAHRAACASRAGHPGVDGRSDACARPGG